MRKITEIAAPTPLDRLLAAGIGRRMADFSVETRLWGDGPGVGRAAAGVTDAAVTVTFRSRKALLRSLFDPGLALPECYVEGSVELAGDLLALLEASCRAGAPGGRLTRGWRERLAHSSRPIVPDHARRNARGHYDLGTDFFALWLDATMTYTCGYFRSPTVPLEQAQRAKMDYVCRKLGLGAGERVVEAGCGWGALALHMAEHYGARVRAFNVSSAQLEYAREQARRRHLADRVEFVEEDYRAITGSYDAFVSVGMLETVGLRHYAELGSVIEQCLTSDGRGLVHSIGRSQPFPTDRWIARYIFPGSYYPSLREMMDVFEPNDLMVTDVENLRQHYVRTLEHWLTGYEKSAAQVATMFSSEFERMWRLYLNAALAAFRTGWLQLYQVVFTRSQTAKAAPTQRR